MKETIRFSCGHEEEIQIYGKAADRKRKIEYFEKYGTCSECYKAEINRDRAIGKKAVRMPYSEYKRDYSECETKYGSYDRSDKTIEVYIDR